MKTPQNSGIEEKNDMNTTKKTDQAVFIHGPQGCGKTTNGAALAKHFNKTLVIEAEQQGTQHNTAPSHALVLSIEPQTDASIPFESAMQQAGISPRSLAV